MKRFEFKLARVRDLRKQQAEVEEAKLGSLMAERAALEAELARIEADAGETRVAMRTLAAAQELAASDGYLRHLARRKNAQEAKIADWHDRALKQRAAVTEARRKVRLLESLEQKQLAEWKSAADREQENLSAELYLARWSK